MCCLCMTSQTGRALRTLLIGRRWWQTHLLALTGGQNVGLLRTKVSPCTHTCTHSHTSTRICAHTKLTHCTFCSVDLEHQEAVTPVMHADKCNANGLLSFRVSARNAKAVRDAARRREERERGGGRQRQRQTNRDREGGRVCRRLTHTRTRTRSLSLSRSPPTSSCTPPPNHAG